MDKNESQGNFFSSDGTAMGPSSWGAVLDNSSKVFEENTAEAASTKNRGGSDASSGNGLGISSWLWIALFVIAVLVYTYNHYTYKDRNHRI